jgi:hypothetical protein
MKIALKKLYVIMIICLMSPLFITQLTTVYSSKTSISDEVLIFLEEVVQLDVSKYDIEILGSLVEEPYWLGGLKQITGKISLKSQTSKIDVLFRSINNTLSWCLMREIEGSPQYTKTISEDILDVANNFLQEYQVYSRDSNIEDFRIMLDTVDVLKNATKKMGNMEFEASFNSFSSSFSLRNKINGAEYSGITINFKDEDFYSFIDNRSYFKVGGTEVNIEKEEALNIALNKVEEFSWTIAGDEITDFGIAEEHLRAELLTRSREPLVLYPYWLVTVPLDDIYPGNVNCIIVSIWADTSEIIECLPQSFGGDLRLSESTGLGMESQVSNQPSLINMILVIVTLGITIMITLFFRIIKNRFKVSGK